MASSSSITRAIDVCLTLSFMFIISLTSAKGLPLVPPHDRPDMVPQPVPSSPLSQREIRRNLYILSIGVNAYHKPLQFAVSDAQDVALALAKRSKWVFQSIHSVVLCAGSPLAKQYLLPTRHNILSSLYNIANISTVDDVFVFFFSGYSIFKPDSSGKEEFHLIPYWPGGGESARIQSISAAEMRDYLDVIPAQRQVVILDAAVLGGTFKEFAPKIVSIDPKMARLARKNICVIGLTHKAPEIEATRHGIITTALLEALDPKNDLDTHDPNRLSMWDVSTYIKKQVPRIREGVGAAVYWIGQDFDIAPKFPQSSSITYYPETATMMDRDYRFRTASHKINARQCSTDEARNTVLQPRRYYISFATDHYDSLGGLNSPIPNSRLLGKILTTMYGFTAQYYDNLKKSEVENKIDDWMNRRFNKGDQLVILVSGHGTLRRDSPPLSFIAFKDSAAEAHDYLTKWSTQSFTEAVNNILCPEILLILDMCFAGSAQFQQNPIAYGYSSGIPGGETCTRYYIASCGIKTTSDGPPGNPTEFTRAFITILSHPTSPDGRINIDELRGRLRHLQAQIWTDHFGYSQPQGSFEFHVSP